MGDVAAAVQTVQAAGGTLESEPTEIGREVIATCADPFGNGFCLVEYRNG